MQLREILRPSQMLIANRNTVPKGGALYCSTNQTDTPPKAVSETPILRWDALQDSTTVLRPGKTWSENHGMYWNLGFVSIRMSLLACFGREVPSCKLREFFAMHDYYITTHKCACASVRACLYVCMSVLSVCKHLCTHMCVYMK